MVDSIRLLLPCSSLETTPFMIKPVVYIAGTIAVVSGLLVAAFFVPLDGVSAATDLIVKAPGKAPAGMVWVPGGTFRMGNEQILDLHGENPDRIKGDEGPAHTVELDGFFMDETPVTNRQFTEFVAQTGYVTFAERKLTKADFAARGADVSAFPSDEIPPGSMCFNPNFDRTQLRTDVPMWEYSVWQIVDGANWKHPDGPDSTIDDRMDHPVVHIAWEDAAAYAEWAGKRLPTEAEFEYAARNGGENVKYPWGNDLVPSGTYMANYWQGEFPKSNRNEDGFAITSPVKTFPANELGLYDLSGNVWEWCSDLYAADYYSRSPRRNPKGPTESFDPEIPGQVLRVQRGGSFLCNDNNCTGYRTTARGRGDVASSSYHTGFRCVVDARMYPQFLERQEELKKSGVSLSGASTEKVPPHAPLK